MRAYELGLSVTSATKANTDAIPKADIEKSPIKIKEPDLIFTQELILSADEGLAL